MMALGSVRNQYLDGGYGLDCAQDTAAIMDKAVKAVLDVCYKAAVEVIEANREDMDKVVAYLLEKETITGGEMVAILEGRDPALVEGAYTSTRSADNGIEPPARHVHIVDEPIPMPPPADEDGPEPGPEPNPRQPGPDPESKPDPKPEPEPESEPESEPEPKPGSKTDPDQPEQ